MTRYPAAAATGFTCGGAPATIFLRPALLLPDSFGPSPFAGIEESTLRRLEGKVAEALALLAGAVRDLAETLVGPAAEDLLVRGLASIAWCVPSVLVVPLTNGVLVACAGVVTRLVLWC